MYALNIENILLTFQFQYLKSTHALIVKAVFLYNEIKGIKESKS